ncbi:translation initiation factor IF-2 subunit beta [Candidatus Bathyarchaeota archaeon]|nr:translation initiation factor IF-2 subunit beta [Candidatus Bathyarchaeota archaeon]
MEKDYKSMLNRAYDELPEQSFEEQDRFQVPRARVTQQGRRSIIMNFNEIAETIQRDPEHLLKFLLKETATRGNYDGTRVVFQGKFTQDSIRNLIEIYTNKYVICPVCGRPDTNIVRDKRLSFLQCDACGARSSIGKS